MFNRKEFNERITKEYNDFVNETLQLDSKEIFEKSFEISFKKTMTTSLTDDYFVEDETAEQIDDIKSNVLNLLFELYDDDEGVFILDDIIQEVIEDFIALSNEIFEE
jgi:hypothetical protein